jgi:hypothetical protein
VGRKDFNQEGKLTESRDKASREGVKGRAAELLRQRADSEDPAIASTGLTLGEIGGALGLPKTAHGELSAAMNKLRNEGRIKTVSGPATSPKGPRFVKRYSWARRGPKPAPAATVTPEDMDARRFLSLCR